MTKNEEIPARMIPSRKTIGEKYEKMPEYMRPEKHQTLGFETDIEEIRDILRKSSFERVETDTPGEAYSDGGEAVYLLDLGPIDRVSYVEELENEDVGEVAERLYNENDASIELKVDQGLKNDIDPERIREII